jgi:hypothetical protein
MKVSELLTLMGHLSVGNDNITPTERAIFLQYLNLAHLELYQETANFNEDLLMTETLTTQPAETGEHMATLSKMPYMVSSVYTLTTTQKLPRLSVVDVAENTPDSTSKGAPTAYFVQKDTVRFVPIQTTAIPVIVWYVPQPSALTDATDEQARLEGDIPYPAAYHPVLADGALYYLFQEEGGFKNTQKELEAKARWEAGKSRLLSYLYTSSDQTFSTFSSV